MRPMDECLFAVSRVGGTAGVNVKANDAYSKSLVAASLYVDYIFLDTDERRRMAQNPHEYLIEQLQFTGDESIGSSSNKIKLNFNHPCKELVWVVQPDDNVSYCDSFVAGQVLNAALGAQPFNYTDAVDALPNSIRAFSSTHQLTGAADPGAQSNTAVIGQNGLFNDAGANNANGAGLQVPDLSAAFTAGVTNGVSDAGAFVLAETALNMHCWGENPVVTAKLQQWSRPIQ